jgi:hypothetical protein
MAYSYSLTCHPTYKTGAHDIYFASPFSGSLLALGVATDGVRYQNHPYYIDVHGDRNGGHQGPPIEKQYLGEIVIVSFSLTTFNSSNLETLRKRGMLATNGTVPQTAIGDFMLTAASMRLLLKTELAADVRNFWCAVPIQAHEVTEGTKFSEWSLSFECHRPPCGHPKAGILEDKDYAAYA